MGRTLSSLQNKLFTTRLAPPNLQLHQVSARRFERWRSSPIESVERNNHLMLVVQAITPGSSIETLNRPMLITAREISLVTHVNT